MTTSPTSTLKVAVAAQIDSGPGRTTITTIPIPPDYNQADRENFYGFVIERTAGQLLDEADWPRPRYRALRINASRLWLIEQLIAGETGSLRDAIQDIIERDDDQVLADADLPPED